MPAKRTLTDRFIRSLKPAPKGERKDHMDAVVPGFGVRVTDKADENGKAAQKTLILADRYPGSKRNAQGKINPTRRALGEYGALTLEQARAKARHWLELIARGIDPAVAEERERRAEERRQMQTADAVLDDFLARHVEGRLRTEGEINRILDKFVRPRWKGRGFVEIGRGDVAALLDDVEADSGPRQADIVLAVVRKAMAWHEARNDAYRSPIVKGMGRYKASERKRERILTDDEIRRLWPLCEAAGAFGAIVRFGLLTAQRREKLASSQWDDVRDGVWTIRREPREKSNAGSLRLPQMARDIVEAQPRLEDNPYIFAGRGGVAFNAWSKSKAALDAKLPDLEPWTIHDLRRSARSLMSRAGVKPHIAERVLGHAIAGVESVYDRHSYSDEKAAALEALAGLIGRILKPADNVVTMRQS